MVKKTQYLLVHSLAQPARTRVQNIINHIIRDYDVFDMRGIDPHITLKYYIGKRHLAALEKICADVARRHRRAKFSVGGVGDFGKRVLFLNVKPSTAFTAMYNDLFTKLKENYIPLDTNEERGIHFHVTLAQGIRATDFPKIRTQVMKQQLKFNLELGALTILEFSEGNFSIHKKFTFARR